MKWSDISSQPTTRTLREFSCAWLVFLLAIGGYQYFAKGRHGVGLALGAIALIVGVMGLIKPAAVRWLFVGCMVLAFPIGWTVSQTVLLIMYFVVVTPVAFLFRLRKRDALLRFWKPERLTFWTPKEMPNDPKAYFKQY